MIKLVLIFVVVCFGLLLFLRRQESKSKRCIDSDIRKNDKTHFKINGFQKLAVLIFSILMTSCVGPTPRRPVSHHSDSYMEKSVALNKKINAAEETAIKKYIALDSLNTYLVSPDGFWYKYEYQINDEKPVPIRGNEIIFEYEILSLNEKILYSKETLGKISYLIDKEDITSGLQNGLKLMKEGEEVVFLFPSFKAFGFTGDQQKIGVNQPLIYKVKLIKIKN